MRRKAFWVLIGGLAALPAAGQEQVRILAPGAVTFQVDTIRQQTSTAPSLLSFSQAILSPTHRLRISVQATTLDLAETGDSVRLLFTGSNAQGGTAFSGQILTTAYTTVFEGNPLALSGSVQIAWSLDPLANCKRAGAHDATLRWKVETFPSSGDFASRQPASAAPSSPGTATELGLRHRGRPALARPAGAVRPPAPPIPR